LKTRKPDEEKLKGLAPEPKEVRLFSNKVNILNNVIYRNPKRAHAKG
jgi:hypothetical protein